MHDTDDGFETVVPGTSDSSPSRKPAGPSLKARAIGYLSRREHSRRELARKLGAHAADPEELEHVLDDLERENWLSDHRFVQSLINRRSSRQGTLRIVQELRQHGISDDNINQAEQQLRDSETDRAHEVWQKKFGSRPANTKDYARQYRFMMSRGFPSDCVRTLLGDLPD